MKKIIEYKNENIDYLFENNKFTTDYDIDLNIFIIWSNAKFKEKEIIADLSFVFEIVELAEIYWSKKNIDDNFHRLYGIAPNNNISGKRIEVGSGSFIAIVVKDKSPVYLYREDASKNNKIVNVNVVDKKQLYREWVGGNYLIHSSDNLKEFFNNSTLLFGKDKTLEFCTEYCDSTVLKKINKDLIGSNGWSSSKELFDVLNLSTQYVVLRGSENIEKNISSQSGDVDVLCSNVSEFTAVANAVNLWSSDNFFHVEIDNKKILFDIRSTDDNYFDKKWSDKIIRDRVISESNIFIPRVDDYFFSHLYHAYIHKPYFFDKYIDRLSGLSSKIGIIDFKEKMLINKKYGLYLLKGYLLANKYSATIPRDLKVFINIKNMSSLQKKNYTILYGRILLLRLIELPFKITIFLKEMIKKNKMLFNLAIKVRDGLNKIWK